MRETHYKNGCKEGEDSIFDRSGRLKEIGSFKENHPIGLHQLFFEDGSIQEKIFYHDKDHFDKWVFNLEQELIYEGFYDQNMVYRETKIDHQGKIIKRVGRWVNKQLVWE